MYKDITGIILSGGKSTRMGENKSLLKLGGKTVIEHTLQLIQSLFSEVILITNTPDEYQFLNIPMFEDIYRYRGPLAGIHSGLINSQTDDNFIISCDIPLMTTEVIKYIVDFNTTYPITVCRADGFIQQLAGKYSKTLLPKIENLLKIEDEETRDSTQKKRKCKVHELLNLVGCEIIEAEELEFYSEGLFLNMNRPEDYTNILSKFNQHPK